MRIYFLSIHMYVKIASFTFMTLNFSAQSNNEQHNRTNTTIAALSAAADSSSGKPSSYHRLDSTSDHDGMHIEFRNFDPISDNSSFHQRRGDNDDMELGVSSNGVACNNLPTIASAKPIRTNGENSGKIRFHEQKKGALIRLSNNSRTAERRRPYDDLKMVNNWI